MAEGGWLEVSLVVYGEMAEAVAEVLARFAPGGVAIESTAVVSDFEDAGHPTGPLRVCGYLPVDADLERNRRRLEEALWYLGRIRPLPEAQFKPIQETNWAEAWKQHYRPLPIGQRLIVVPAWLESPDPSRIPVKIDPGMAFGTGTHPTTQLCLEMIEEVLAASPGASIERGRGFQPPGEADWSLSTHLPSGVIDVGCGSGILAVAALKLGVERGLGVDIDPDAIASANQNAAANGVAARLELRLGSVSEILAGSFSLRSAPLVVANILAPVIVRLFGEGLAELLEQGGAIILSGILDEQAAEVESAGINAGLRLIGRRQQGDWVALAYTNKT